MAKVGDGKCGKQHACRALHRLVEHAGVPLRLKMDAISIVVKRVKPLGTHRVWWPCITMQEWTSYLPCNHAQVLLPGHRLDETTSWKAVFLRFGSSYGRSRPPSLQFQPALGDETRRMICLRLQDKRVSYPQRGLRNLALLQKSSFLLIFSMWALKNRRRSFSQTRSLSQEVHPSHVPREPAARSMEQGST